jgi:hypothetical protein
MDDWCQYRDYVVEVAPGVGVAVRKRLLCVEYHVKDSVLLWLIARGMKNLVLRNRGSTTCLKASKVLAASFLDQYGQLSVFTSSEVPWRVYNILQRLSDEGLLRKYNSHCFMLDRQSALWDVVAHSMTWEVACFLRSLYGQGHRVMRGASPQRNPY